MPKSQGQGVNGCNRLMKDRKKEKGIFGFSVLISFSYIDVFSVHVRESVGGGKGTHMNTKPHGSSESWFIRMPSTYPLVEKKVGPRQQPHRLMGAMGHVRKSAFKPLQINGMW